MIGFDGGHSCVQDGEWMVVSLLNGKVLPFPTDATPPGSVELPSQQQSSASKTGQPLQTYKRRRALLLSKNFESRDVPDLGVELLVKKPRDRSIREEHNGSSCPSRRAKSGGKQLEEGEGQVHVCWLGKGFTLPLAVLQLADGLRGPYSHSLAHKRFPKKFLYYEAFICNGVEYFLGDIVEVKSIITLSLFDSLRFVIIMFAFLGVLDISTKHVMNVNGGWAISSSQSDNANHYAHLFYFYS